MGAVCPIRDTIGFEDELDKAMDEFEKPVRFPNFFWCVSCWRQFFLGLRRSFRRFSLFWCHTSGFNERRTELEDLSAGKCLWFFLCAVLLSVIFHFGAFTAWKRWWRSDRRGGWRSDRRTTEEESQAGILKIFWALYTRLLRCYVSEDSR